MVQSLVMCLRPGTPRSLTEPVSFGFIDPSRRVSRAELDRMDKLWRDTQPKAITGTATDCNTGRRDSLESDMTRVEGRQNFYRPPVAVAAPNRTTTTSGTIESRIGKSGNVKSWLFLRKQQQQAQAA